MKDTPPKKRQRDRKAERARGEAKRARARALVPAEFVVPEELEAELAAARLVVDLAQARVRMLEEAKTLRRGVPPPQEGD